MITGRALLRAHLYIAIEALANHAYYFLALTALALKFGDKAGGIFGFQFKHFKGMLRPGFAVFFAVCI